LNCPNCGHEITADDRFCSNCGARLDAVAPSTSDASDAIQPSDGSTNDQGSTSQEPVLPTLGSRRNAWEVQRQQVRAAGDPADDDDWKMSDLGPAPPRKRRTWLWIVIAILALMVLACCIFMYWVSYTDGGQDWFSGIATEAAEIIEATEQASATPEASPAP
jgi:ferric-dicitrate binding protein FerR (iron transport regulator)